MNLAQTLPLADSWGMHGGDVGVGWMIVMVLFWAAIILGVVWLFRGALTAQSARVGPPTERPLETLDRRFAEGAITTEEYRERRAVLTTGAGQGPRDDQVAPTATTAGERR